MNENPREGNDKKGPHATISGGNVPLVTLRGSALFPGE
jgi:hypothetical protein